jgi:hypothetical protein
LATFGNDMPRALFDRFFPFLHPASCCPRTLSGDSAEPGTTVFVQIMGFTGLAHPNLGVANKSGTDVHTSTGKRYHDVFRYVQTLSACNRETVLNHSTPLDNGQSVTRS